MNRHQRGEYYVTREGVYQPGEGVHRPGQGGGCRPASTWEELRRFRFSRLVPLCHDRPVPAGGTVDTALSERIAQAMTPDGATDRPDSPIPAGYTYLGQLVDHDLTENKTRGSLGERVTVEQLVQGRSPALDLDSLYGLGPGHPDGARFYEPDGVRLRTGRTAGVDGLPDLDGFDLAREDTEEGGRALIPDARDDENLAVAQLHLAFIRFHNRIADDLAARGVPRALLFEQAREMVVLHYQWVLRHDYLPRIVDPAIVEDVFTHGRQFFEVPLDPYQDLYRGGAGAGPGGGDPYASAGQGQMPTMPIEFSIAAFRIGHSMVRDAYQWNSVFNSDRRADNPRQKAPATLPLLFTFSGTAGVLTGGRRLPSYWIPDWRRLFDLVGDGEAGPACAPPGGRLNRAKRIDTLLGRFLGQLPPASFGGCAQHVPAIERNLAYRNLVRADMVGLAGGQQAAEFMKLTPLSAEQILSGRQGADLTTLDAGDRHRTVTRTPLWFYVLREAELNDGVLTGVGGRIVAEVLHRAMEGSRYSIVRRPAWQPDLRSPTGRFTMAHLILHAFDHDPRLLNPVG